MSNRRQSGNRARRDLSGDLFLQRANRAGRSLEREDAMRRMILRIPQGMVSSYAKVAAAAGYPGYHRQAAQLLRREGAVLNWQRVVGAGGEIKTRAELGDLQRRLLEDEGVRFCGERVNMEEHEYEFRPWEMME